MAARLNLLASVGRSPIKVEVAREGNDEREDLRLSLNSAAHSSFALQGVTPGDQPRLSLALRIN